MPPKPQKESKKTEQKRQEKVIEDKTFGLKNKNKSKTVQNYVKSVAATVKGQVGKGGESKRIADEFAQKAAKKKEEEKKALLASLFKSVKKTQEEIDEEVEEEQVEENYEEIDLYTDQREQIYGRSDEPNEELENWRANKDKTDKVCKYFLDSVEAGKYGWRWTCPNGFGCIYKHALPPGFVLKGQAVEEKKDDMTLEERLEYDRAQLQGGTPVTLERFLKWKEDKKLQKEKEFEKKRQDEVKKSGGKGLNVLSGRALFTYDPTLFQDDAEALDDKEYEEEENRDDEEEKNEGVPEEDEEDEEDGEEEEEPEGKDWGGDDTAAAKTNGTEQIKVEEGEAQVQTGEEKKKKKKKKKKAAPENDVQINEDVFLGEEDVELPEDDS